MPTKEQVKEQFKESFERADTDGTGKLTQDQVKQGRLSASMLRALVSGGYVPSMTTTRTTTVAHTGQFVFSRVGLKTTVGQRNQDNKFRRETDPWVTTDTGSERRGDLNMWH